MTRKELLDQAIRRTHLEIDEPQLFYPNNQMISDRVNQKKAVELAKIRLQVLEGLREKISG